MNTVYSASFLFGCLLGYFLRGMICSTVGVSCLRGRGGGAYAREEYTRGNVPSLVFKSLIFNFFKAGIPRFIFIHYLFVFSCTGVSFVCLGTTGREVRRTVR